MHGNGLVLKYEKVMNQNGVYKKFQFIKDIRNRKRGVQFLMRKLKGKL